jgi:hypothetical protein
MGRERNFLVFVWQDCYRMCTPCDVIKIGKNTKVIMKKREIEIDTLKPKGAFGFLI